MRKYLLLLPLAALLSCNKSNSFIPQVSSTSLGGGNAPVNGGGASNISGKVLLTQQNVTVSDPDIGDSKYIINYVYDANGLLLKRTVDAANEQPFTYNAIGQLTSVGKPGADQSVFTFTYDAAGNLTEATENDYDSNGKLDVIQYLKYSVSAGHVMQTTVYNEAKALLGTYDYTYSGDNIAKEIAKDSRGTVVSVADYTYGTNHSARYNARFKFYFDPTDDKEGVSTNELLIEKNTFGPITTTDTYQYTYDKTYPVTGTLTITNSISPTSKTSVSIKNTYGGL